MSHLTRVCCFAPVCDYGIDIAKKLNLPLVLLNVIEHSNISKKVNLSGNIGLGSKDDLLEELANEEMNESKQLILKGKAVLKVHISEYSDSNAGVQPDTFAMRFSRL